MNRHARQDVQYFLPGRSVPFAGSTVATADLLALLADECGGVPSRMLRLVRYDTDARDILRGYIAAGCDVPLSWHGQQRPPGGQRP